MQTKAGPQLSLQLAERLWMLGFTPYVPHLSMLWHIMSPHSYEYWLEQGAAWVKHSDVVLRLPGASPGSDLECDLARKLQIPVFTNLMSLQGWTMSEQVKERYDADR